MARPPVFPIAPQDYNPDAINVLVRILTQYLTQQALTTPSLNAGSGPFPMYASAPPYVQGGMYYNTTTNKLYIGGATAWEAVTSV